MHISTSPSARASGLGVPEKIGFASKPALAIAMIERALAAALPFSWVAADSVYGVGDIEMALRQAAKAMSRASTAKNELGFDHNETRSWHGWHRHVSLVMLAFAMMAAIRHHANTAPPPKNDAPGPALIRWSVQESRRIATSLAQRRINPADIIA